MLHRCSPQVNSFPSHIGIREIFADVAGGAVSVTRTIGSPAVILAVETFSSMGAQDGRTLER